MATQVVGQAQHYKFHGVPYLSDGQTTTLIASTELMNVHIKVYSNGGENGLHAHPHDDHTFVVLEGQATFYFEDGSAVVANKYEGMLIPRGCMHYFQSTGDGNLVMLRVGAWWDPKEDHSQTRSGMDSKDPRNKTGAMPGVPIPGKFFGHD